MPQIAAAIRSVEAEVSCGGQPEQKGDGRRQPHRSFCSPPPEARQAGWLQVFGFCLLAVIASRLFLFCVGALGLMWNGMPVDPIGVWVRWDASLYLDIAANGYSQSPHLTGSLIGAGNLAFFFRFTPLAMRVVSTAIPDARLAGMALSRPLPSARQHAALPRCRIAAAARKPANGPWPLWSCFPAPSSSAG